MAAIDVQITASPTVEITHPNVVISDDPTATIGAYSDPTFQTPITTAAYGDTIYFKLETENITPTAFVFIVFSPTGGDDDVIISAVDNTSWVVDRVGNYGLVGGGNDGTKSVTNITPATLTLTGTVPPVPDDVFIKFGFESGDDETGTLIIDADNEGTFTATSDDGSSGDITYNVNGGGFAAFSNPTELEAGDTIAAKRTITTGAGYAKISGTYV